MNTEKKLYQWDTGQKLTGCTGLYVDFPIDNEVYRVETADGMCIIPDELLQTSGGHKVYECMTNNTIRSFAFSVTPRPKPPDYVFTPTERLTFEGLVQKVDDAVADMIRKAESGEFDGYTPIKGTDYFTTEEIQQIQNEVSSGAIGEFKSVVDTETDKFNANATEKVNTYNQNDSQKTTSYNANATAKLNAYNTNANNKVAEFDTHTEQIQTDISELKSDLISLLYETLDYQLEIGVNRIINSNGVLQAPIESSERASTPPFDFEYKNAVIKNLKYPVKLYGFDNTRWYVIYDSSIDSSNCIDTENYTKLFIQVLAKAPIPSTETELFEIYGVHSLLIDNLVNKHEVAINTGSISFFYLGKWEIGGITNGQNAYAPYRVRSSDFMVFSVDTKVYIEEGRRLGVQFFNDDGTFKSDSGWQTKEYVIPKNTKFKCVISGSLNTDDNEHNITPDIRTFGNYISAQLDIFKRMDDIEKAAIKKSSVNAYPMKPTNTLIDFLQGENTYRMQGATIKGDVLYYSMTNVDTEATIYKHDILNNTPITSVTGNFGHAGDLTYNPNTNEIITLNASYSYTTLYILDADSLELKRTVRIDTTGWRVATIAYNPSNKGYVFELSANGTWKDYKFAIADENFNILSEFSPIKNGYLLQGIECDGKFIYALYAEPNIIIVYDIGGNYRGYHKLSFNTESECIAKYDDTTFFVGEDGEKKIYKMTLSYEWE